MLLLADRGFNGFEHWQQALGRARCGQADEALSFTAHVQLLRRELPRSGAFPPSATQTPTAMAS
jgi:hypothetical protein